VYNFCLFQSSEYPVFIQCEDFVNGGYKILVDSEYICSCGNIPLAFGLYLATFYVLNLAFPQHSVRTLTFLQKYGLGINDATRDPFITRATRLCTALMEKVNSATKANKSKHTSSSNCGSSSSVDDVTFEPSIVSTAQPSTKSAAPASKSTTNNTSDLKKKRDSSASLIADKFYSKRRKL